MAQKEKAQAGVPSRTHQNPLDDPMAQAAAFDKLKPQLAALLPGELRRIVVNIPKATSAVLGALPKLGTLRTRIQKELPEHPIRQFDALQSLSLALLYAYNQNTLTGPDPKPLQSLLQEGEELRADLLESTRPLIRKGLLEKKAVDRIREGKGHVDTANDLMALGALYQQNWPQVQGKTTVTQEQTERAVVLGQQLLSALGARERNQAPSQASDQLQRMFTLFAQAYDETRRAVEYLRYHEADTNEFLPPLHAGRPSRSKRANINPPAVSAIAALPPGTSSDNADNLLR